jgi:phosphoribosylglycinamide formyltransferase-1
MLFTSDSVSSQSLSPLAPRRIAIFASGSGSNAQRIIEYFQYHPQIRVALVLSNNPKAGVLERAARFDIPVHVFNRTDFYQSDDVLGLLESSGISFLVLAGFLWLMPSNLVQAFPGRIVNIHPALLPKYGGKGMYGLNVHKAVVEAGEKESGITIHFVNEHYDEGQPIFQATCPLQATDTPEEVALKVLELEHRYFPRVIEQVILGQAALGFSD